jgi:hypothetical protein
MVGAAALAGALLWGLLNCFLGYPLFRLILVFSAVAVGAVLGAELAEWLREAPTRGDYVIACGTLIVLSALLAWFFYRLGEALLVGGLVAGGLAMLTESPAGTALAISLGVAMAVMTFLYMRPLLVLLTAVGGGFSAVFTMADLLTGQQMSQGHAPHSPWLLAVLIFLSLATATCGFLVQLRLLRVLRASLTPRPRKKRGAANIQPRFWRP